MPSSSMSLDEQQQVICDLLNLIQQWQGEVKSVCQCVCECVR